MNLQFFGGRGSGGGRRSGGGSISSKVDSLEDAIPGINYIKKTPLKVASKEVLDDIGSKTWSSHIGEDLGVQTVSIGSLYTVQEYVRGEQVESIANSPSLNSPVTVMRYKGQNILFDGNHRTAASKLLGKKTIRAHVYTWK